MLFSHRILPLVIVGCLTLAPAFSAKKEKKSKEEQMAEKEKKSDEKNQSRYEKVKDFALNKYKTDPEFRDEVDRAFDEKMREHSERAFKKNTERKSTLVTVHEDTWRQHDHLYDNLLVQDHVNRIGQRLVPADSDKLYAFKVVPDPTPSAETLSTGTIYVSTGLISMLDSEAQLAFVLAHEMAHVHLDHWREDSMMRMGEEAYNESQTKKAARIGMIGSIAGAAIGGVAGKGLQAAMGGAAAGALAGGLAGYFMNRPIHHVEWDKVQEDQADEMAFKAVLNASYDVREVPKLYASLDKAAAKDARVQLGFLGQRKRIKQRIEKADNLIANAMKAEIELKAKNGFVSSSAEHRNLMAELKRDNGILAFYHDMFEMARTNLGDAVSIRDNDPAAHYYYAKTLKLVGRTEDDARMAKDSFYKATKADTLGQNYGSHLHLALMMAREKGTDVKQVAGELDTYVTNYAKWRIEDFVRTSYPPNLGSIYEYMSMYGGDPTWKPKVPDLSGIRPYIGLTEFAPQTRPSTPETVQKTSEPVQPAATNVEKMMQKVNTVVPGVPAVKTVPGTPKKK